MTDAEQLIAQARAIYAQAMNCSDLAQEGTCMSGLLSCPFCGGDPSISHTDQHESGDVRVFQVVGCTNADCSIKPRISVPGPWGYRRKTDRPSDADALSEAIAAWNRRAEPGWQPISSAPRDGTRVDLWVVFETGARRVTSTYYDTEYGEWWMSDYYHAGQYAHRPDPTHWMPLPAPPQDTSGVSDEVPGRTHEDGSELSPGNSSDLRGEEG